MDDLTFAVLKMVLAVATALITAYLIPYIKTRTSADTQERVSRVITTAVEAAEQTMNGGDVKKEIVMDFGVQWLASHNIKMSREQLDQLVEAVVYEVKQEKK